MRIRTSIWIEDDRGKVVDRLVRAAREAAKQSRRAWVPEIMPVAGFAEVLKGVPDSDGIAILADLSSDAQSLREVLPASAGVGKVLVLVGPEGGFTDAERDAARDAGVKHVRLDGPIMRIETACAALTTTWSPLDSPGAAPRSPARSSTAATT